MLILVPEPPLANKKCDVQKSTDGDNASHSCEQSEENKNAGNELRCFADVHHEFSHWAVEGFPVHVSLHYFWSEDLEAVIDQQQTHDYAHEGNTSVKPEW